MGGRPIGSTGGPFESYEAIAETTVASGGGLRMLPTPPFMHGAAQWASFITWTSGGTLVVQDVVQRLDPVDVVSVAAREKVISMLVVGDAIARPILEEIETGKLRPLVAVRRLQRRRAAQRLAEGAASSPRCPPCW